MTETPNPHMINTDTLTGGMRPIRTAVVSMGSNLGDRFATLKGAISALADTPGVRLAAVSAVYETAPADGAPADSPDFLNAVLLADTTLSVATLLERIQAIEAAFGRHRSTPKAPRILDLDLIVVGNRISVTDELQLPHPRAHERAFVLVPWQEVDAGAQIPGKGSVADLVAILDTTGVVRRPDLVLDLDL